jgi:hypothetical protein
MKELLSALANVKRSRHVIKTATNPFFKSKYFDINSLIEQVDPLLEKNGLLLLQPIEDGKGSKCDLSRRHRNERKRVK